VYPDDPNWHEINSEDPEDPFASVEVEDYLENAVPYALTLREDDGEWMQIADLGAMNEGTHLRATFSYSSCPGQYEQITNPLALAVNFDLGVCGWYSNNTKFECIFFAESLDDSNEGFHIVLPRDYDEIGLYLIQPAGGWSPCVNYEGGMSSTSYEPSAWSAMWWTP